MKNIKKDLKLSEEKSVSEEKTYLKAIIKGIAIDCKIPGGFADVKNKNKIKKS